MTKDEFWNQYQAWISIPTEEMVALGYRVEKCDCKAFQCNGWRMVWPHSKELDDRVAANVQANIERITGTKLKRVQ